MDQPRQCTLDVLVHPWYGMPIYHQNRYGRSYLCYEKVQDFIKNQNLTSNSYAELLFCLYAQRVDALALNSLAGMSVVLLPIQRQVESLRARFEDYVKERLPSQRLNFVDEGFFGNAAKLPSFITSQDVVEVNVYGEISHICVQSHLGLLSNLAGRYPIQGRIVKELCGDLVDGKKDALAVFREYH